MKSLSEILVYGAVSALLVSPIYADSITIPIEVRKNGNYILVGGGISREVYANKSRIYSGHVKTRKNAPKALAKQLEKIGLYNPKILFDFTGNVKTNVDNSIDKWNAKLGKIHQDIETISQNASEIKCKLDSLDENERKKVEPYVKDIEECAAKYWNKEINDSELITKLDKIETHTGINKSISKNIQAINNSRKSLEHRFGSSEDDEPTIFEGDFSIGIQIQVSFDKLFGLF